MDETSKKLLVINTHVSLFRYKRMSFGIKTAPTIFQQAMDIMISKLKGVTCFMDDIFIFGETKQEHDESLINLMKQ